MDPKAMQEAVPPFDVWMKQAVSSLDSLMGSLGGQGLVETKEGGGVGNNGLSDEERKELERLRELCKRLQTENEQLKAEIARLQSQARIDKEKYAALASGNSVAITSTHRQGKICSFGL